MNHMMVHPENKHFQIRDPKPHEIPAVLLTCVPGTGDGLDALAPESRAGRRQEAGALVFRASFGVEGVNSDPVLTGEEQAGKIDVVLLQKRSTFISDNPPPVR